MKTTTQGAKSLGVHKFAMRIIRDCYDVPAQTLLQQGLVADSTVKQTYIKSFMNFDVAQRKDVLTQMAISSDATAKSFADMIKGRASTSNQNPSLTFMAITARAADHAVKEM